MTAAARGRCLQFEVPADHSVSSHFGVLRLGFDSAKDRAGGWGEAKYPASGRLCRLIVQTGEAPKIMAACNWKQSESGEMELRKALPLDLGARTKCAHAPQELNLDRSR